jgi:leucine dehydrogenase
MQIKELTVSGFEKVYHCIDSESGLNAMTVIHNTKLGKISLGGCRMFPYNSDDEMLEDCLTLASKMTTKNALAKLGFGGSKCVIRANPDSGKSEEMLLAMGRFIDALDGQVYTGQDSGITNKDVETMSEETGFLVGIKNKSGDPAVPTALGVYSAIVNSVRAIKGVSRLEGLHIVVYGLGGVGYNLLHLLSEKGAKIFVSDINIELVNKAVQDFGAIPVYDPKKIFSVPCDIFSPNVTGSTLAGGALDKIKVDMIYNARKGRKDVIVCGGTNVLFCDDKLIEYAHKLKGFHYLPAEVVNAGGVISVASEITGENKENVRRKVLEIGENMLEIIEMAKKKMVSYNQVAYEVANERVNNAVVDLKTVPF